MTAFTWFETTLLWCLYTGGALVVTVGVSALAIAAIAKMLAYVCNRLWASEVLLRTVYHCARGTWAAAPEGYQMMNPDPPVKRPHTPLYEDEDF